MTPLATRTKKRPAPRLSRRTILLVLAAAAILLSILALRSCLFGGPRTLPEQVQSQIPSWVDKQLLTPNPYSRPETPVQKVNAIVIHYVGNPGTTAGQNRSFFAGLAAQTPVEEGQPDPNTYASSHFLIGLDGEIIQCVPVNEVAYCSSDRNSDTVSIEVCHPDAEGQFTEASMASLVKLTAWLCEAFHLSADDVIRHYDVTGKECPLYYVHHPEAWQGLKEAVAQEMERGD